MMRTSRCVALMMVVVLTGLHQRANASTLSFVESFPSPGAASQLVASDEYGLLFLRNSASAIRVVDTTTQQQIDLRLADQVFRDIDLSPSGRYLYAADWGRVSTGYGTLINKHHVHRYDLSARTWEKREVNVDVGRIEAIDDDLFITLESDQWVDVHLQRWEPTGGVTKLDSNSADYYGDIEYDAKYGRLYHGNSGSSSREINVIKVDGVDLAGVGGTSTYGSAQQGGGTSVLSFDSERFYYGRLQVEALDVTNNTNMFPSSIYAATADFAFGSDAYYDAHTAQKLGDLPAGITAISSNGTSVWRYHNNTLSHYTVPEPSTVLMGIGMLFGLVGRRGARCTRLRTTPLVAVAAGLLAGAGLADAAVTLKLEDTFTAPVEVRKLIVSEATNQLFVLGEDYLHVLNPLTHQVLDTISAESTSRFYDLDMSPSGKYLFVSERGGIATGYGTLTSPHYVHRYDMQNQIWERREVQYDAGKIEAVGDDRFVTLEQDQHVDVHLQQWEAGGGITHLDGNRADYYGDIEYHAGYGILIHGSSGSSSREVHVINISGDDMSSAYNTGVYGTAQSGGGSSVLSPDGERFYYGRLELETLDVTNVIRVYEEIIYVADHRVAVGSSGYYDPGTGAFLGSFGYRTSVNVLSTSGASLWRGFGDTLYRYSVPEPASSLGILVLFGLVTVRRPC